MFVLFCGFAAQGITHHKFNDELYQSKTKNIENLLMNMINDTQYCGHCINRQSKQSSQSKIQLFSPLVKTAFNILSIMNIVMTFTIFSGPKSITTFILINALVVFASVYVRGSLVVLFGSFDIITSLIVYMKSLYTINKTMMTINTRSRPEKDDEV